MSKSACIITVFNNLGEIISYCLIDLPFYHELREMAEDQLYLAINDMRERRVLDFDDLTSVYRYLIEHGIDLADDDTVHLA